jgi:hypothetical protein
MDSSSPSVGTTTSARRPDGNDDVAADDDDLAVVTAVAKPARPQPVLLGRRTNAEAEQLR